MKEKLSLHTLNNIQREAVECTEGPSMIIAGAGSGKTNVLTYKVAHLIQKSIDPKHILVLTFTNKAANEMKDRICKILPNTIDTRTMWVGTFHSIFFKILRIEFASIGYVSSDINIYDQDESKRLIGNIAKELGYNMDKDSLKKVKQAISKLKMNLISVDMYMSDTDLRRKHQQMGLQYLAVLYKTYQKRCKAYNVMDFDDIIFNFFTLIKQEREILSKYQNIFKYILVDEYQDTNYAQYLIIKYLSLKHKNVTVVGDDAQSIYAFRGANIENIFGFKKDYPQYKIFKLEQNYRSTSNIVQAANSLISKNERQIQKNVWTDNIEGSKIKIVETSLDQDQGAVIVKTINDVMTDKTTKYSDFAIFYRSNYQSAVFEEALRKANIPYVMHGGTSFYQRAEIKNVLGYFNCIVNTNDTESLKRIINMPTRGIGSVTVTALEKLAQEHNTTLWNILKSIESFEIFSSNVQRKIIDFRDMMLGFIKQKNVNDAFSLAKDVVKKIAIKEYYIKKGEIESRDRIDNIDALLNAIAIFTEQNPTDNSIENYLPDVFLISDVNEKQDNINKVALMTVHLSKGLEYDNVFVVGLNKEVFPSPYAETPKQIEEERRLLYVAMTRAKKQLYLTNSKNMYRFGRMVWTKPSIFLQDIDMAYTEKHIEYNNQYTSVFAKDTSNTTFGFRVGDSIDSDLYGVGRIVAMEGKNATVIFNRFGKKSINLRFIKPNVL